MGSCGLVNPMWNIPHCIPCSHSAFHTEQVYDVPATSHCKCMSMDSTDSAIFHVDSAWNWAGSVKCSREDTSSEEEDDKDDKPKSPKDQGTDRDSDNHPDNSKDDSEPETKDSERESEHGSKSQSGNESDDSFKDAQQIEEELSYINEPQSQIADKSCRSTTI